MSIDSSVETVINHCHHCNDVCADGSIDYNDYVFCCNGCVTVYRMLEDGGLQSLYNDGVWGVKPQKSIADLNFLDLEETQQALLDFTDGELARVTLELPAIHCSSCVHLLERLSQLNEGVKQCRINFPKKSASILFNQKELSLRQLAELLASIGYSPELDLAKIEGKEKGVTSNHVLLYKLGVAGFCFGNIMLLSFPEYLGGQTRPAYGFGRVFNYLNLLLVLPVVFYSGVDYLKSAFRGLRTRNINMDVPVAIGMMAIFVRSGYDILSGTGVGYLDALAGFVFFLLIGKWYQAKTYSALSFERDYRSFFPIAVRKVAANGTEKSVMIRDLQVDDIINIRYGELIPADAKLLSKNARIDYSFVTGEADPVKIELGQRVFAGGKLQGEKVRLKVLKPVSASYLISLWNSSDAEEVDKKSSLVGFSGKVAEIFSVLIISIALITAAYWLIFDSSKWLNAVSAVLIIACPCALALSIPFTFGTMIRHFGRHGLFVRSSEAIDRLGLVTDIVFDKTGTITTSGKEEVHYCGDNFGALELEAVINLARQSVHPLSKAIVKRENLATEKPVSSFTEIPGRGSSGVCNGLKVELLNPEFLTVKEVEQFQIWGAQNRIGARVAVKIDGCLHGRYDLKSTYRSGLAQVVKRLSFLNAPYLLSGDNDSQMEQLTNSEIAGFASQKMHFNLNPHQKQEWVSSLQKKGQLVLMIGDGLNDAGALMESYFGISVAENSGQFTPASDAILQADSFEQIPSFIRLAKNARSVVYAAFAISILYNIIGISVAVTGNLSPVFAAILMPLSSVSIVLFTTLATTILVRRHLGKEKSQ